VTPPWITAEPWLDWPITTPGAFDRSTTMVSLPSLLASASGVIGIETLVCPAGIRTCTPGVPGSASGTV
jgi:hypothetical protein